jgi:hypothetical protein
MATNLLKFVYWTTQGKGIQSIVLHLISTLQSCCYVIKKIRDMVTLITLKSNKFSSVKFSQQRQWAHLTSNFEHHKLIRTRCPNTGILTQTTQNKAIKRNPTSSIPFLSMLKRQMLFPLMAFPLYCTFSASTYTKHIIDSDSKGI